MELMVIIEDTGTNPTGSDVIGVVAPSTALGSTPFGIGQALTCPVVRLLVSSWVLFGITALDITAPDIA